MRSCLCARWLLVPLFAAGCGGLRLSPLPIPTGMAPATLAEAARWADSTRPAENRDLRFRWKFQDQYDATFAGRGRVRLALPDSVRFDAAGSLGIGRVAAFVAGDTAIWAEPEKDMQKLVPNYQLFWAMLGVARVPAEADAVRRVAAGTLTAWQFSLGQDTVEYVRDQGAMPRLIAEVRQGGKRLARVETKFGPDGLPASSRLIVVRPTSKLELTFYQNVAARPFAPDTWIRPAPPGQ
jgi:hypothetical protein